MSTPTKLKVPVTTLIEILEGKIAQDQARVTESKRRSEAQDAKARAKIVSGLRKEADRIEAGGKIKTSDMYWDGRRQSYAQTRYDVSFSESYESPQPANTSLLRDLGLLKATSEETIVVASDSNWASYL